MNQKLLSLKNVPSDVHTDPLGVQFSRNRQDFDDGHIRAAVLKAQSTFDLDTPGEFYFLPLDTASLHFPPAAAIMLYPSQELLHKKVMASTYLLDPTDLVSLALAVSPTEPTVISQGTRVATLVPVIVDTDPYMKNPLRHATVSPLKHLIQPDPTPEAETWFLKPITAEKPLLTILLNGVPFTGLVDTGADVSVIAQDQWPPDWPLTSSPAIKGVGGVQMAQASKNVLTVQLPDSQQTATLKPVILPLHVNLWGRDLLSQLGSSLHWM